MKKILENVFKLCIIALGNDTNTLKQKKIKKISSISTKIFSTDLGRKN